MSNLSNLVRNQRKRSDLLTDRELISSEDIARNFKRGITLTEVDRQESTDRNTGNMKHYYICTIAEDDTVAIGTGQVLTNMIDSLIETLGSIEDLNAALKSDELTLIPLMKKSKNGNKYLDFEVAN